MASPRREMALLSVRDHGWRCSYCASLLAEPFGQVETDQQGWDIYLLPDGEGVWQLKDGHAEATRDHVVPRCDGGPNDLENLVLACRPCNTSKGTSRLLLFLARRAGVPRFKTVGTSTPGDFVALCS